MAIACSRRSPAATGPGALSERVQPERVDHARETSLLFAEDVATMVGMTRKWVYTETRAGRIPHVALGRYSATGLNR